MKYNYLITLLLSAGIAVSINTTAAPRPQPETQNSGFVGFTTNTFDGGQGVATYTNACGADYVGSSMCTSEEYLNSNAFPTTAGSGWIKPTYVPSNASLLDMSGTASPGSGNLSCNGWSRISNGSITIWGLYVDSNGKFDWSSCTVVRAVACCM